uniref:(northern house mosquito) hypothetical protein n=1 Tax=Culex pipiens TaxID=7175 RepID=A0A8D8BP02_CULPI
MNLCPCTPYVKKTPFWSRTGIVLTACQEIKTVTLKHITQGRNTCLERILPKNSPTPSETYLRTPWRFSLVPFKKMDHFPHLMSFSLSLVNYSGKSSYLHGEVQSATR